jgi:hypothetical protein
MTKKEIRRIATRKLNEGKKRQQVLIEIREEAKAPVADIAAVLKFTPSKRTKKKYKLVNSLLLTVLILTIVLKLAMGTLLVLTKGIAWLPLLFLLPLLNIYLAYEVANYKGQIYKWVAVFSLLSFLRSTPSLFNGGVDFLEAIDLVIVGLLIFLGLYLNRKFAAGYKTKREAYINDLGQRRGRDVIFFND